MCTLDESPKAKLKKHREEENKNCNKYYDYYYYYYYYHDYIQLLSRLYLLMYNIICSTLLSNQLLAAVLLAKNYDCQLAKESEVIFSDGSKSYQSIIYIAINQLSTSDQTQVVKIFYSCDDA